MLIDLDAMRAAWIIAIAAAGICDTSGALGQTAAADRICAPRADLIAALGSAKWHETPTASGLANTGLIVEVLTAENGKTWTIIVTQLDGYSCVVAAGEGWQTAQPKRGGTSF